MQSRVTLWSVNETRLRLLVPAAALVAMGGVLVQEGAVFLSLPLLLGSVDACGASRNLAWQHEDTCDNCSALWIAANNYGGNGINFHFQVKAEMLWED